MFSCISVGKKHYLSSKPGVSWISNVILPDITMQPVTKIQELIIQWNQYVCDKTWNKQDSVWFTWNEETLTFGELFWFVTLLTEACPRFLLIGIAAFRYEWIYKCLIVEFSHLPGNAGLLTFQKTVKLSRRSYLPGISGRAQPSTFLGGTLITVSALQVSSCKVERVKWQALERGNRKPKEERVGINIPHSGRIERWYCSRRIPWTLAVGQGRAEIWSQGEWYPHPSRLSVWGREWSSPTRASEIRTSLRNYAKKTTHYFNFTRTTRSHSSRWNSQEIRAIWDHGRNRLAFANILGDQPLSPVSTSSTLKPWVRALGSPHSVLIITLKRGWYQKSYPMGAGCPHSQRPFTSNFSPSNITKPPENKKTRNEYISYTPYSL